MNEADIEERERMNVVHNHGLCKCCDNLMSILASRDTYWKERVEKEIEKLIDANDDGMWACREVLDKLLDNLK